MSYFNFPLMEYKNIHDTSVKDRKLFFGSIIFPRRKLVEDNQQPRL